jgi:UDP-glucose:(heptosyl)LPS alpha-1,3-glucosyltransferase
MKIALVIERLDPTRGGAETWAGAFTRALAARGHDVHVYSRRRSVAPEGVTPHPVAVSGVGRTMRTMSFARNVEAALAEETYDIVQGIGKTWTHNVYQPHGGVHAATMKANLAMLSKAGATLKRIAASISPKECVFRRIERRQFVEHPAEMFVALSQMVRSDMQRFYNVPDEKISIVYNGVDTERFNPQLRAERRAAMRYEWGIAPDDIVFLIVAHNWRLKGVHELVRCVTGKLPRSLLVVVGRGDSSALERFASARQPGRVRFPGAVDDAAACYAAADAYVHPTWYDPCSLTVLEALASGLPVVTTPMNGASELMTDGEQGFIVPPGDREALHEALSNLFDPTLREKMGRAARTLAEAHTLGHNVDEMIAVFEKVLRLKGDS